MNVRFTEPCRETPLELQPKEEDVRYATFRDGRTNEQMQKTCEKDIFIGVFFDGTNNNKYRDTPSFSHSNVARLYEVYPGTPAGQTTPKFLPRINPDGSKTERPVFPDKAFKPSSVPPEDMPYYRKVYVPGLGTPMPDGNDTGTGIQKTGGLAMALLGQVRLDWAMLQLINQVHAAVFKQELAASVNVASLLKRGKTKSVVPPLTPPLMLASAAAAALNEQAQKAWDYYESQTGTYDPDAFAKLLNDYEQRLAKILMQYGNNKPTLRKIRLSVFGFSRGAAEARAWVNMVTRRWAASGVAKTAGCQGIPLQIDFLGIFDTVASVGLVQITPNVTGGHFEGHGAWAHESMMPVPANVKRCAHLVAALEVRGSFPLDSVCQSGMLPPNCKEIVYPGVHSDVGGGYPPDDQGRALGQGAAGDKFKLSQISLAQMYREARMAGVPLAPESSMLDYQKQNFAIAPRLREDFNDYVAATRSGTVPPTQGTGSTRFASMFPTETQPREELYRVMRRHAGYLLRWRKAVMSRPGGMAGLPGLKASQSVMRFQDMEDFRGAEEELRKEIAFLRDPNPKKFEVLDDAFFDLALNTATVTTGAIWPISSTLGGVVLAASWMVKNKSLLGLMQDKQRQWDAWLQDEWNQSGAGALPAAAERLFERYVHDSRAWFKALIRTDRKKGEMPKMVADDESWFTFGEREKERKERVAQLNTEIAEHQKAGKKLDQARCQDELNALQQEGQPLLVGGREPYRMWGYVRHRTLYQAGKLDEKTGKSWPEDQQQIKKEEEERIRKKRDEDAMASEKARHDAEIKRLKDANHRVLQENRIPQAEQDQHTATTRYQISQENAGHEAKMKALRERANSGAKETA
jgi:uncharacterized protein (DUF2235 family)